MSSKSFNRADRVADSIKKELSLLVMQEFGQRVGIFTISKVKMAKDLSYARVYISILTEKNIPEAMHHLEHGSGFLRHMLAKKLQLRVAPSLKFFYDDTIARASRISSLINQAVALDAKNETEEKNNLDSDVNSDE